MLIKVFKFLFLKLKLDFYLKIKKKTTKIQGGIAYNECNVAMKKLMNQLQFDLQLKNN